MSRRVQVPLSQDGVSYRSTPSCGDSDRQDGVPGGGTPSGVSEVAVSGPGTCRGPQDHQTNQDRNQESRAKNHPEHPTDLLLLRRAPMRAAVTVARH
jgi:hypothetical protein